MDGDGTGKLLGKQRFVCRKNFALFCPIETVIPEKDFLDGNPKNSADRVTSEKLKRQEQIRKDEMLARSMSYSGDTTGKVCVYLSVFFTPRGCFIRVLPQPVKNMHKTYTVSTAIENT